MTIDVVLATRNTGKLVELQRILDAQRLDVRLLSAADLSLPEPEETGETFEDNALLKARASVEASGRACLADDSGLVVDALGGEPGVRSARYAGRHGDDEANLQLVLDRMAGVDDRSARFVCVAALVTPRGEEFTSTGTVEGALTSQPRGDGGFGYDPIFQPVGSALTTAEMEPAAKDAISHRGQAFRGIAGALRAYAEQGQSLPPRSTA
ncbi:MAG: RdgB/HAM1 family non-canonical purine NTP pyrophosphatase [Actinobacteria bacterium]|nr:RdgB/HAM1 family non-canonical purine NTP pyrophosphatase [Actinomycetota bacterium]